MRHENMIDSSNIFCTVLGTLMFTALGSFFNRISDPEMGEPYTDCMQSLASSMRR